jgi:BirA family biotin operon repressor/biotin-[acetyl-CoA-carboxylase] ligase
MVMRSWNGSCRRLVGKMLFRVPTVSSTNDLMKTMASRNVPEGTVVVAETQTTGRGRLGRRWFSPKGGLWFSVLFRPKAEAGETAKLVFVASLAVAEVLQELCGLRAETKWPNDVLVNGKKICGILAEMKTSGGKVDYAVVGVGVNVNFRVREVLPEPVWETATSVEDELGKKVDNTNLLLALIERLDKVYAVFVDEGSDAVLKRWKGYAGFLGHQIRVDVGSESLVGAAVDVTREGALALKFADGSVREFHVGDVSVRVV